MVSIKGISVKKITYFKGHEGESLVQCEVYYKGKKVGFYSQDSWGGCDRLDTYDNKSEINEQGINKLAQEYLDDLIFQGIADNFYIEHREYFNFGNLIQDIIDLHYYQKAYKKNLNKGYNVTIVTIEGEYESGVYGVRDIKTPTQEYIKNKIPKLQDKLIKYIFASEQDFVIA